jgi:hypothetical protein
MIRRQVTLFVPREQAAAIEAIRSVVDPIQKRLIPAHVTVCRDEETASLAEEHLYGCARAIPPVSLQFVELEQLGGHGILLNCSHDQGCFDVLRTTLLGSTAVSKRAHITLAHPRNPRASGNVISEVRIELPIQITFTEISLIEQRDDRPWTVLQTFQFEG